MKAPGNSILKVHVGDIGVGTGSDPKQERLERGMQTGTEEVTWIRVTVWTGIGAILAYFGAAFVPGLPVL